MRTVRIYQAENYSVGEIYSLSAEAGQHVGVVLRMQPGETLLLFDGKNQEFVASLVEVQKKRVLVKVESVQALSRESPGRIQLAQAIAKGDRMEWIIQKAVELGAASIQPLFTERCEVRLNRERLQKKCAQWQAIAIAACEQCGRNAIPEILAPLDFPAYLLQNKAALKLVLHPEGNKNWRDYALNANEIAVLIGPEGGFTPAEIASALQGGFHPLRLGPRILRTETAGIAALALLQALAGDL